MPTWTQQPAKERERLLALNLEDYTKSGVFQTKVKERVSFPEFCLDKLNEFRTDPVLDSDGFGKFKAAIAFPYQQRCRCENHNGEPDCSEKIWSDPDVFAQMTKWFRIKHKTTLHDMTEGNTWTESRIAYLKDMIDKGRTHLFLNLGALNTTVFTQDLADSLSESLKENRPDVLLTIGWPYGPEENPQQLFSLEGCLQRMNDNPFIKVLSEYANEENSGDVLLIYMSDRLENHFVSSLWPVTKNAYRVMLGLELLHHEKQINRLLLKPQHPDVQLFEYAIVINHLMHIDVGPINSKKPTSYWFKIPPK